MEVFLTTQAVTIEHIYCNAGQFSSKQHAMLISRCSQRLYGICGICLSFMGRHDMMSQSRVCCLMYVIARHEQKVITHWSSFGRFKSTMGSYTKLSCFRSLLSSFRLGGRNLSMWGFLRPSISCMMVPLKHVGTCRQVLIRTYLTFNRHVRQSTLLKGPSAEQRLTTRQPLFV